MNTKAACLVACVVNTNPVLFRVTSASKRSSSVGVIRRFLVERNRRTNKPPSALWVKTVRSPYKISK